MSETRVFAGICVLTPDVAVIRLGQLLRAQKEEIRSLRKKVEQLKDKLAEEVTSPKIVGLAKEFKLTGDEKSVSDSMRVS